MKKILSNNINNYKDLEEFAEYNGLHIDDVIRFIENEDIEKFDLASLTSLSVGGVVAFLEDNNVFTINGITYIDRT